MNLCFENTEQISKSFEHKPHVYPKYGKSTTDPTYYEPSATRIANMKKASGMKLEGIYDFYSKDDVSKFNEDNFNQNLRYASVDPRFSNKLVREEISQITNELGNDVQDIVDSSSEKSKKKNQRISEEIEIASKVQETLNDPSESSE